MEVLIKSIQSFKESKEIIAMIIGPLVRTLRQAITTKNEN